VGKRTIYEPGTFCWIELSTTDPDDAKRFYGELFGWEPEDNEIPGDGRTYTMARIESDVVAGITAQPEQQRSAGIPPNWFSYAAVTSADDAAARAAELGGTVHAGPFDVGEAGRMAVIGDPTGAMLGAWEARDMIGAGRVNEPGCLTWNELATSDVQKALSFYEGLFGWSSEVMQTGGGPAYTVIRVGERANGGIRELSPQETDAGAPPYWFPYIAVDSLDDAVASCGRLGGGQVFGPIEFPAGRIGGLRDGQGALFAIWDGVLED
jgi:predicted enzyme related to lactoylglutathione lyase